jgi:hypothetical protein
MRAGRGTLAADGTGRGAAIRLVFQHGLDERPGMTGSGPSGGWPAGAMTPPGHRKPSRGRWSLAAGDAESVLAEARKAFFAMSGSPGTQPGLRKPTDSGSPAP